MRFLSVGPEICLQFPSDSTSRWTPLLLGYTLPTIRACLGLPPIRARPWRANSKKSRSRDSHLISLSFVSHCATSYASALYCNLAVISAPSLIIAAYISYSNPTGDMCGHSCFMRYACRNKLSLFSSNCIICSLLITSPSLPTVIRAL